MASNASTRVQRAEREEATSGGELAHRPTDDMVNYLKEYARENPEYAALWCFGIGFVLGWKLKPW